MDTLAYLSVLLIPLLMGLGVLGYLTWQIVQDRKREGGKNRKIAHVVFAILFWLLFIGFYIWRGWPEQ